MCSTSPGRCLLALCRWYITAYNGIPVSSGSGWRRRAGAEAGRCPQRRCRARCAHARGGALGRRRRRPPAAAPSPAWRWAASARPRSRSAPAAPPPLDWSPLLCRLRCREATPETDGRAALPLLSRMPPLWRLCPCQRRPGKLQACPARDCRPPLWDLLLTRVSRPRVRPAQPKQPLGGRQQLRRASLRRPC